MNTQFTKGEWFVYNEKHIIEGTETMGIECKTTDGDKSIIVFQNPYSQDPKEELANAKLIAASPFLLNELENAIETIKKLLSISRLPKHIKEIYEREISNHKDVINKATL